MSPRSPQSDRQPPRISSIAALCLVSAAHAYSLSAFFAYAGFLAVDLGWATDLDHVGVVVGVLGTCLPAARIPVSMLWGLAMDRFGRRPCLVLTSCCLCVGQVAFARVPVFELASSAFTHPAKASCSTSCCCRV